MTYAKNETLLDKNSLCLYCFYGFVKVVYLAIILIYSISFPPDSYVFQIER